MPCDFCSYDFPPGEGRWQYDLKTTATIAAQTHDGDIIPMSVSDPWWMACDACAELIRNANRRRLAMRAVPQARGELPGLSQAELVEMVEEIQAKMFWTPWLAVAKLRPPLRRFD